MKQFAGKVAVITGAASGIGLGLAKKAASSGMSVVLADIEAGPLAEAEREISSHVAAGAAVLAMPTDVADAAQVDALADAAFGRFGAVHLLCNNAGVGLPTPSTASWAWENTLDDWAWILSVNLMGHVHGVRSFVPRMLERAVEGHIVNTVSAAGLVPSAEPYGASKFAALCYAEGLYANLKEIGAPIGVSALCPGFVTTRITQAERNKPEYLARTDVSAYRPAAQRFGAWMEAQTRAGYSPDHIADVTFDAIVNDHFYVMPIQPEFATVIDNRLTALLERRNPPMRTGG